jgi:hypothetical protein
LHRAIVPSPDGERDIVLQALRNHDLQIFRRHDHAVVGGFVHARDQRQQIAAQCGLLRRVERRECLEHRAIKGLEDVEEVLRLAVTEVEGARLRFDRGGCGSKHLGKTVTRAPKRRRSHALRRRQVFAERLEQLADKAFRGPVGEADAAARSADAKEFHGRTLLIGREHHAERRDHDVERVIGERQCFRVSLLELDRKPFGRSTGAAALQQRRHVVGRDDIAPAPRGGEADIAVAGGDVEDFLPGAKIECLAQLLADDLQCRADDGIVAGRPGGLLPGFHRGEVGRCGCSLVGWLNLCLCCGSHCCLP